MSDQDIIAALQKVNARYGKPFTAIVEQLFRNETAHFKSEGFAVSLSPGMEATVNVYPYGWSSLKDFWDGNKQYAPIGLHKEVENSSAMMAARKEPRTFIVFQNLEASMLSVAFLIAKRGGDGGSWFSVSDEAARAKYNAVLNSIIPRFTNANIK